VTPPVAKKIIFDRRDHVTNLVSVKDVFKLSGGKVPDKVGIRTAVLMNWGK
jgi:hypothetical protein